MLPALASRLDLPSGLDVFEVLPEQLVEELAGLNAEGLGAG